MVVEAELANENTPPTPPLAVAVLMTNVFELSMAIFPAT